MEHLSTTGIIMAYWPVYGARPQTTNLADAPPSRTPMNQEASADIRPGKPRRFMTLSLSSAFIMLTLFGVGLGAWSSIVAPVRRQWALVRPLMEKGVIIEMSPSMIPEWLAQFLPDEQSDNIDALFFRSADPVTPEDLAVLKQLPYLKRVYIQRSNITDKHVAQIAQVRTLERLAIWGNWKVTNRCVDHLLQIPNLRLVDVHDSGMDWRAAYVFAQRPELKVIEDFSTPHNYRIDHREIEYLAPIAKPDNAFSFTVTNCNSATIPKLLEHFPKMNSLLVDSPYALSIRAIERLSEMEQPRYVRISVTNTKLAGEQWWDFICANYRPSFATFTQRNGETQARFNLIRTSPQRHRYSIELNEITQEQITKLIKRQWLTQVKGISFHNGSSASDLELIQPLKQISQLRFYNCDFDSISDVNPASFPELQHLKLHRCSLSKFDAWENDTLATINMAVCNNLTTLDNFDRFKNLKRLDTHELGKLSTTPRLGPSIEYISFNHCRSLTSNAPIADLPNLAYLHFGYCQALLNVSGISALPKLKTFQLMNCQNLKNISNCQFSPDTRLNISGQHQLADFTSFQNCSGLTNLAISRLESWTHCNGIERLPALRQLSMENCENIESLTPLRQLKMLQDLEIQFSYRKDREDLLLQAREICGK